MNTGSIKGARSAPLIGELPSEPKARLKKATDEFEAIWVEHLMKDARPKSGMLGKSFASETYHDMLDQSLAKSMAERGVFGLSEALSKPILQRAGLAEKKK